jgi:hypothetical protein
LLAIALERILAWQKLFWPWFACIAKKSDICPSVLATSSFVKEIARWWREKEVQGKALPRLRQRN